MFDNSVTRMANGLTNLRDTALFSDMPVNQRIKLHEYTQDFDQYIAADFTTIATGAGTVALSAGNRGSLLLTNSAALNDLIGIQKTPAAWSLSLGLRNWLTFTLNTDSPLADGIGGLYNTTSTPFTAGQITDGMYVSIIAGVMTLNLAANSVITSKSIPLVAPVFSLASIGQISLYWDGGIYASAPNGRVIAEISGSVTPARVSLAAPANFPRNTINLAPAVVIRNSTAAARSAVIDLLYLAQDRLSPLATPPF